MDVVNLEIYGSTLRLWKKFRSFRLRQAAGEQLNARDSKEMGVVKAALIKQIYTYGYVALAHWMLVHGIDSTDWPLIAMMTDVLGHGGQLGRWHESAWRNTPSYTLS